MQDYKGSPAIRKKTDAADLHIFFSPYRVPTRLTDEEVLMCIALSPFKRAWEWRAIKRLKKKILPHVEYHPEIPYTKEQLAEMFAINLVIGCVPTRIPPELVIEKMTRARFRTGLKKLIKLMLAS